MKKKLKSWELTPEEKQNGNRAFLTPIKGTREKMEPITHEMFTRIVKRAIPPSSPRPKEAKQT